MARRRTRYTVLVRHADTMKTEKLVVLTYSAEMAREFYVRRGYHVLDVTTGDYRSKPHIEQRRNEIMANASSWRLDRAALREAIASLGIELPVTVKQTGRVGGRFGAHSFRPLRGNFFKNPAKDTAAGGLYHHITVKSYLDPKQAGETLWHELCHAMQSEQAVANAGGSSLTLRQQFDAWAACEAKGKGVTYRRKPIEVEARSYEVFNDERPLAR